MSNQEAFHVAFARSRNVSRPMLIGGLIAVGFANGVSKNIFSATFEDGLFSAVFNTFDISVFVWLAVGAGLLLVASSTLH
ncbi:hypothetical protein PSQ19_05085 [Devosia algicola]|uniref:Uncharacterized protein n=1 Tax=Devosia algicola TaxID=3026418 RepID=A0ABY7YQB1_9HYPH|nr:hypothetical protein [Devosia algicola]WDR03476.1 hypothetical protein PSQ19_05085 [Devosia algicola]